MYYVTENPFCRRSSDSSDEMKEYGHPCDSKLQRNMIGVVITAFLTEHEALEQIEGWS